MFKRVGIAGVAVLWLLVSNGAAELTVPPRAPSGEAAMGVVLGSSFTVQLPVTGEGSLDSVVFCIELSDPGLTLTNYAWGASFQGSAFDGSIPASSGLPVSVDMMTYDTPGAEEKCDLYFDNFTPSAADLADGFTLLSLDFEVPLDYDFGADGQTVITVMPDTFANAGTPHSPVTGGQLVLTPEPGTLALIALGCLGVAKRRRR